MFELRFAWQPPTRVDGPSWPMSCSTQLALATFTRTSIETKSSCPREVWAFSSSGGFGIQVNASLARSRIR